MEKVEKTSADTQRENELIDQWTMLQWERMAVVQPKAGSGVPGAPANWQLRPGMEVRVPVVFLDLNNDDEEEDVVGEMVTGELFGEKPETMMRLPILQHDEYQVRRTLAHNYTFLLCRLLGNYISCGVLGLYYP